MAAASGDDQDAAIERFKVQKLIASLQKARGSGTSMISLILSPGTQVSPLLIPHACHAALQCHAAAD